MGVSMETIGSDPGVVTVSHSGVSTHSTPWEKVSSPARTGADVHRRHRAIRSRDSLDRCLPEAPPAKLTTAPGASGDRGEGQRDPLRPHGRPCLQPAVTPRAGPQLLSTHAPQPPSHLRCPRLPFWCRLEFSILFK